MTHSSAGLPSRFHVSAASRVALFMVLACATAHADERADQVSSPPSVVRAETKPRINLSGLFGDFARPSDSVGTTWVSAFPESDSALSNATLTDQSTFFKKAGTGAVVASSAFQDSVCRVIPASLETDPPQSTASCDEQACVTPIYALQQSPFQQADGSAFAGPSATRGTWVLIAPYLWVAGVNGQVGVGSRIVNLNITPGEALAHLGDVDGALMLHSEVGKNSWGMILDVNLLRASTAVAVPAAAVNVTLQQTMIELLGMYRLVESPGYLVDNKPVTVDLLAGARAYEFGNILTVRPVDPLLPTVPLNLTASWVDMVIGGRTRIPVTNSLDLFGRADIGGFGVGSSSILAWNLQTGVDYRMTSCSSLIAGYRDMNINKTGGVGATAFDINAKLYGPFLAVAFQF